VVEEGIAIASSAVVVSVDVATIVSSEQNLTNQHRIPALLLVKRSRGLNDIFYK
jgi:hypothetical protein